MKGASALSCLCGFTLTVLCVGWLVCSRAMRGDHQQPGAEERDDRESQLPTGLPLRPHVPLHLPGRGTGEDPAALRPHGPALCGRRPRQSCGVSMIIQVPVFETCRLCITPFPVSVWSVLFFPFRWRVFIISLYQITSAQRNCLHAFFSSALFPSIFPSSSLVLVIVVRK